MDKKLHKVGTRILYFSIPSSNHIHISLLKEKEK